MQKLVKKSILVVAKIAFAVLWLLSFGNLTIFDFI